MNNNKMPIFITFVLIIGFLGTSITSYFVSLDTIRNQITHKQLPLTSDNVYSEVQNDLLKPIFISSLMASDTFLRDWVLDDEKDISRIEKYLTELKLRYGVCNSFFVSEETRNYYYLDGILKKIDPNKERDIWYFRVKNMPENYEINVDADMAHNDYLTIFINYKVFDYDGKYIGATGVGLQVDKVNTIISNYQKRYTSKIHFVDKNGLIKLSSSQPLNTLFHIDLKNYIENLTDSNNTNSFGYKDNGENILVNIRYIPEFNWYLIVEQSDKSEKDVLVKTLAFNSLITFLISAFIISIISKHWRKHQNQLKKIALTDKLTGIFNREAFESHIDILIEDASRNKDTFSMIIFDIDNFKYVNDNFGHLTGDFVIKTIINLTCGLLDERDNIFRWGGDEFVILLKGQKLDTAFQTAERIRESIKNEKTLIPMNISISLGVVEYQEGENIDCLIKRADELMYKSKSKGKNNTEK